MALSALEKPLLSIDFDGVIHDNAAGFVDASTIPGGPVPGAIPWLYEVGQRFQLVIFTARGGTFEAQTAVVSWLAEHGFFGIPYRVTDVKLPSILYVDDRGWQFEGVFPSVDEILAFEPWNIPDGSAAPVSVLASAADAAAAVASVAANAEPYLSIVVAQAAAAADGRLVGSDQRLKGRHSLAAKIGMNAAAGASLEEAAADIHDAVRYTVVVDDSHYSDSVLNVIEDLAGIGLTVWRLRNYWPPDADPSGRDVPGTYVGINAVFRSKDGYPFEVQFHTPDSQAAQELDWDRYRALRAGSLPPGEEAATVLLMRSHAALVPRPPGAEDLSVPGALTAAAAAGRADSHNAVVQAAMDRAARLEPRLAAVLEPILAAAGIKAAAAFRERAPIAGLTAALRAADKAALGRLPVVAGAGLVRSLALTAATDHQPGVTNLSTMIAVKPRPEEAAAIAHDAGLPPDTLHITLAYLGEIEGDLEQIAEALRPVAASHAALAGEVGGAGFFGLPDEPGPTILLPDVPGLVELRVATTEALQDASIEYAREHGFEAHVTVVYRGPAQSEMPAGVNYRIAEGDEQCLTCSYFDPGFGGVCRMFDAVAEGDHVCDEWTDSPYVPFGAPLHFDSLLIVRGDTEIVELPLVGPPPLTAAGDPQAVAQARAELDRRQQALRDALESGDQTRISAAKAAAKAAKAELRSAVLGPTWAVPGGDEVLDIPNLVQTLRTKTDPVREQLIKTTMTPALRAAGISFDLSNPFAAKVLAQSASQITNIAQTTQLNVMRIIGQAHDQGLSIPDTAKAITDGMKEASVARATLIARTELVGAANGGSLAATQIVASATGDTYTKKWSTSPGAPHPRHEEYDGLDGQEQPLDGYFDVGGSNLQFPGDPDGPPEEVCNCRCTMLYGTPEGEQESDADSGPPDVLADL